MLTQVKNSQRSETSQPTSKSTPKRTISTSQTRLDANKLRVGEYLSDIQYYKIAKINPDSVTVVNERGFETDIDKDILEEGMYSASQYQIEKAVTRTELAEILEQAGNQIFSVNFNKQLKEKDLKDKLLQGIKTAEGEPLSYPEIEKVLKKISKEALQGEERTLVGYLVNVEPKMGRSLVIDLEARFIHNRLRLIDHRTLNWLILKNVKYVVN